MVAERRRNYEVVLILRPEANEEEVKAAVERVTSFVTERGGDVSDQENWGLRQLAYPIQRFQEGNYVLARFALDSDSVAQLDRSLTASQDVLRHLVVKVDEGSTK